jgi:2,4-dienoyl-CoA reductase (NADPH2)
LCGDELIEGGTTIDDAVDVARMVEEQHLTDYLNTSIGVATASLFMIEASMQVPPGYALFIPSSLRKAVDLPVVGVGRFKDPLQAERALAEGHCDLVGVVRGQIADADFAAKAHAGRTDDIRLCLSCNQECVGRMGLNRWLGCIENPLTGREAQASSRTPGGNVRYSAHVHPKFERKVVVVGGGPAGLQAASAAAERGHRVVLFERDDQLGGQARLAATVPSRAEFGDIVRNLVHACRTAQVDVRLGAGADAAAVLAERPDVVIVATGAEPARPYWAPEDATTIVDVRDVLEDRARPEGVVVVIDELGFHQATSVAELLADRGCTVQVVTPGMIVGQDLGVTLDLEHWNVRAAAKNIEQRTDLVPMAWADGVLTLLHHPTGVNVDVQCDWVVLAVPPQPVEVLYHELRHVAGLEVHRIGDCVAPRRAHAAVVEGARVGASL